MTPSTSLSSPPLAASEKSLQLLHGVALGLLRYGLVFIVLLYGTFKFFAFEAEGIKPLIEDSPFMSWLYAVFSVRTTSTLIGVFEVGVALLIAARPWSPRLSGLASLAAAGMFLVTLSFLFTTPGALAPTSTLGGFLMKDLMLLGAALFSAAEALLAATGSRPTPARGASGSSRLGT